MKNTSVLEKVGDDIEEHGWHVLSVFGKGVPNFSYTVGFTETLNHPEIIMSGLDSKLAHFLLNDIGNLIRGGKSFNDGDLSDQVLKNYSVKFQSVSEDNILEYFRAANAYYGERKFKALQCVWPNSQGKFQQSSDEDQEIL